MHGRDGYVCGVGRGFPGQYAGSQNPRREEPDFGRDVEHRKVLDYLHPFPRCARVSGACFIDDKLRDVDLERVPALLPPLLRNLLVAGNDQIPAGPRGQIARNGCFQVKCLLHHGSMLPRIMPAEEAAGPGLLNDVAEQTGGRHFPPARPSFRTSPPRSASSCATGMCWASRPPPSSATAAITAYK